MPRGDNFRGRGDMGQLVEAVSGDPEIRERARQFALDLMTEAEDMLHNGAPAIKLQLVRSGLVNILRSIRQEKETDETILLKQQMEEMRAEMRGYIGGGVAKLPAIPQPPQDTPHGR